MVYGMIGNDAQAEFRALGFMMLMGISESRAFDVNTAATMKLVRNMAGVNALRIIFAKSTRGRLTVPIRHNLHRG